MISGGGGGHGAALDRPPESVVDDVMLGFVSREGAHRDYGVVIVENVDGSLGHHEAKTRELRAAMHRETRPRNEEREAIVARAEQRTRAITLSAQALAEVEAVEEKLAAIRRILSAAGTRDEAAAPGQSLRNPFLNDRAMKYWDSDCIDRWIVRHGFQLSGINLL